MKLVEVLILLYVLGGIVSIAFGVYEFIKGEVTGGLLSFILSLLSFILTAKLVKGLEK